MFAQNLQSIPLVQWELERASTVGKSICLNAKRRGKKSNECKQKQIWSIYLNSKREPTPQQTDKKWRIQSITEEQQQHTMHNSQMKSSICCQRGWKWRGFVIVSVLFCRSWVLTKFAEARICSNDSCCWPTTLSSWCCHYLFPGFGFFQPNQAWPHVCICLCIDLHVHINRCFVSFGRR